MNAQQTRKEATRQIKKLLKISSWAERRRTRAARKQGAKWRKQLTALERQIGSVGGSAGRRPITNSGKVSSYEA